MSSPGPTPLPSPGPMRPGRLWRGPLLVAVVAAALSIATRDPAGNLPRLPAGPGLTLDEVYNVEMGVYLVETGRSYGLGILSPASLREVFGSPSYNPDHPPLGRIALGVAHAWGRWWHGRDAGAWYVTADARMAPALAFALTILLVGRIAGGWYGPRAGLFTAIALPLIPRLFGHSHLAALETFVGLAYTATILFVAETWSRPLLTPGGQPPRVPLRYAVIGGVLLGLAFLTKIQGTLACVPIGLWGLWHFRHRAIVPGLVLAVTAFAVFFVGWPWLWIDPAKHLARYIASSTDRQTLYCWYEGMKIADRDVPWHYPFVLFATTVPLGLHLLGFEGAFGKRLDAAGIESSQTAPSLGEGVRRDPRLQLVAAAILFPLVLFALPGIAVYDGERLFLICYPLWGIFIGRGADGLWRWIAARGSASPSAAPRKPIGACLLIGGVFVLQSAGFWTTWPFLLSHYNLAVGGLRGANRLGFERNYWREGFNRSFFTAVVEHVPANAVLHVAPVLHPLELPDLDAQFPILKRHGIRLAPYDDRIRDEVRYVIVHRRMADPWATLDEEKAAANGFRLLTEIRREGVQLAALYESVR